jgi:hypothetical protein
MLDTNAVSAFLQRRSPRLDGWVREQRLAALDLLIAAMPSAKAVSWSRRIKLLSMWTNSTSRPGDAHKLPRQ